MSKNMYVSVTVITFKTQDMTMKKTISLLVGSYLEKYPVLVPHVFIIIHRTKVYYFQCRYKLLYWFVFLVSCNPVLYQLIYEW